MYEFSGIDITTLYDGGFQFCLTGLIRKVLKSTGMKHCIGSTTPTKVKALLRTDTMVMRLRNVRPTHMIL